MSTAGKAREHIEKAVEHVLHAQEALGVEPGYESMEGLDANTVEVAVRTDVAAGELSHAEKLLKEGE